MIRKLYNFIRESAIWRSKGFPVRSDEEMLRIYSICSGCEHFASNSCTVCGCRLHPTDKLMPNKIAWATTKCPLDEPKWKEEPGYEQNPDTVSGNMSDSAEISEETAEPGQQTAPAQSKKEIKINDCGCGKRR